MKKQNKCPICIHIIVFLTVRFMLINHYDIICSHQISMYYMDDVLILRQRLPKVTNENRRYQLSTNLY